MNWKKLTAIILVVLTISLVIYDIFAEIYGGNPSTISQVIYWAARANPFISFAAGYLCGHLFSPQDTNPPAVENSAP